MWITRSDGRIVTRRFGLRFGGMGADCVRARRGWLKLEVFGGLENNGDVMDGVGSVEIVSVASESGFCSASTNVSLMESRSPSASGGCGRHAHGRATFELV